MASKKKKKIHSMGKIWNGRICYWVLTAVLNEWVETAEEILRHNLNIETGVVANGEATVQGIIQRFFSLLFKIRFILGAVIPVSHWLILKVLHCPAHK